MLGQLNKKVFFRFVALVVIGVFLFSNVVSASVVSSYDLRTEAAKKTDVPLGLGRDLNSFGMKSNVNILLRGSTRFKNGVEPVNPRAVIEGVDVLASVRTTGDPTLMKLRGAALGLDKKQDADKIQGIKDAADGTAKGIYARTFQDNDLIVIVRVSEGMGRDGVTESFSANEVVVPDALLGELKDISKAIETSSVTYVSKTGKHYRIKNAIIDVIEGTNAFVSNVGGKRLEDLKKSESGATSSIVMSDGILLGNCPDIYADGIFALVPVTKRQEFINNPLDPELTAQDPTKIESVLMRIAEANGIEIGDLEVVLMDRARETQRLSALKALQNKYPGLEITTISDGTMAHSLLATFGRREGKLKVVMTVGGAPEVFLDTAVASLFKSEGALASARLYSKNVNKTSAGESAKDLSRRYAFDSKEREELNSLRPEDAAGILNGTKLFTQEDVYGDVEGSIPFMTNNGVFNIQGAEKVTEGKVRVNILRVGKINGKPAAWISEKVIDPTKVGFHDFVTSIPDNQPLLNFVSTEAVNTALKVIIEVIPGGVKIVDEERLREYLVDQLVYDATFNPDKQVVELCRKLIRDIAFAQGATLDSVYELYVRKARDPGQYTVPAINIRGMGYNTARAVLASAVANNVSPILEIAKSEIGYTGQRPAEFTTSVLAAAIKEGYKGRVYLQGDHFQISADGYFGNVEKGIKANPEKARNAIKELITEAILAGFYQIDLDMSVLVDWSKPTADEQQKTNYQETALLTAYVRDLERKLGLDKLGIVVNLGGEIGEIGMGLEKGKERNSSAEDLRAFMRGYILELKRLSQGVGYELKPLTKLAVQTGTKHGGVRDAQGKVTKAKVSFNTLAELGKIAREEFGLAGVVQHGASTLPEDYFTVFAGRPVPVGMTVDETLLNEASKAVLSSNPVSEVHLATAYQDTALDHREFPSGLFQQIHKFIMALDSTKKQIEEKGDSPEKAFTDNRKNAWGPFKVQVWNLPASIQAAIRVSLKTQFDTVFNNLGVKDSRNKMIWGEKLAVFADAFSEDINLVLPDDVREINSAREGKVYPVLINYESLVGASPDGIMAFLNAFEQLGMGKGNIKPVLHIARDDIKPEELNAVADKNLDKINEIVGGTVNIKQMVAAVVTGTNAEEVAKQVKEKVGADIYQVIGPAEYAMQFKGVLRIIMAQANKGQITPMSKALKLSLALIPAEGKLTDEQLKKLDALFSVDAGGNFHLASSEVVASVVSAAEEYARQVETEIRV